MSSRLFHSKPVPDGVAKVSHQINGQGMQDVVCNMGVVLMMKGLNVAMVGVVIGREEKRKFHVRWASDAKEKLAKGNLTNLIQMKRKIHI